MQSNQKNTQLAGSAAQGCLDRHAAAVAPAVPPSLRAKLDAGVAQLKAYEKEQTSADALARGETVNQRALRADVYERFLKPISAIARLELEDKPEFPKLIVSVVDVRNGSFVAKANAAADAAAVYQQTFVDHGLGTDFVAQLQAAVANVSASADARAAHVSRRYTATIGIALADATVRSLLGVIDKVLTPVIKNNPDVFLDWQSSKKIRQTSINPLPTASVVLPAEPSTPSQSPAPTAPALVQTVPVPYGTKLDVRLAPV